MTTPDITGRQRYDAAYDRGGSGKSNSDAWLMYSVVLLAIAGFLNTIAGISMIGDSKFWIHNTKYIVGGLNSWGWVALCIGVVQLLSAWGIYRRNQAARWVGVLALSVNAILQLLMMPAYPFWAICLFALDLLAVYGLIAYGEKPATR